MIAEQTLTVRLPASVVAKLKRAAALTYRSVDDIVATTVDAVLAEPASVPTDLAAEFAAMHLLSDQALRAAAQPSLSAADLHRLRQLNHAAGERSLTQAEAAQQGHCWMRITSPCCVAPRRWRSWPNEAMKSPIAPRSRPAPMTSLSIPRALREQVKQRADTRIIGITPCGRATVEALRLNHLLAVSARTVWARSGYHPPPTIQPQS